MATSPCFRGAVRGATALVVGLVAILGRGGPPARAAERGVLEITADTVLDPDTVYGALIVRTSGVTIDGRGALLLGAEAGDPKSFTGSGVRAAGVSGVTLKNIRARGWERGLHVSDANGWTIEGCDFSDNFHDPRFGWGDNGRRGGMLLERVDKSRIAENRAHRVWDGCLLVDSDDNVLVGNDFSHTSNTCLSLWTSCRNRIVANRLTYGIRIDPGEVHARDSTCVLLESGSDDNRLLGNDCTHGGDGIFIRVLNGWVSTGNVFEGNDCSHANNNCVEAWSPRNLWIRNKANGGSYGFWLGASDQNVLIDNEACDNGRLDGPHNSPHLPDSSHAGIVFMFGPSSHTLLRGNVCRGNHGAGIAAIGDLSSEGRDWKAFHWVVDDNLLEDNRWGIYLHHADMLDLAGNRFAGNALADVFDAGNVSGLITHRAGQGGGESRLGLSGQPPRAVLAGPERVRVGDTAIFDAAESFSPSGEPLQFRWQLDGHSAGSAVRLERVLAQPGFHRLALTVSDTAHSDLAWRDLYVVDSSAELGTEGVAAGWRSEDPSSKVVFTIDDTQRLVGASALRAVADPYSGGRMTLVYDLPGPATPIDGRESVVVWIRARNPHVPSWQGVNPIITLRDAAGRECALSPARDLLGSPSAPEAREGWLRIEAPLAGGDGWTRSGESIDSVTAIGFGFDSWGAPPLDIRLDGLHLQQGP